MRRGAQAPDRTETSGMIRPTPRPSLTAVPESEPGAAQEVGVLVLRADGTVQDANAAAVRLLSQDGDGSLARALADPLSLHGALAGVPAMRSVALTGSDLACVVSVSMLARGEGLLAIVSPTREEAVQRAEPLGGFGAWTDAAPAMLATLDREGRVLAANAALRERLGLPGERLRGRLFSDFLPAEERPRLAERLAGMLAGGKGWSLRRLEATLCDRDGRQAPVELSAAVVAAADGQPLGATLLVLETTQHGRVDLELEAYTHDLEQLYLQLERQSEELREARVQTLQAEELARIEKMKNAFLDVAAHELRTPVTIIAGVIECLRNLHSSADRNLLLDGASRSAARLTQILDTALKLMASSQPEFVGSFRQRSLRRLLQDAIGDVAPITQLRSQRIELDVPAGLPPVAMDVSMLRDVVANLLMNAIKFTPDGGTITVAAGQRDASHCWFAVRDPGVGIAEEDLPFIFEGFFATFDTTHHRSGSYEFNSRGPGFGLAVVKKFVDLHNGSIEVETERDHGTCFTIVLPFKRAKAAPEEGGAV